MLKYVFTSKLSATQAFDGGVLYIVSNYILKLTQLAILMLIWNSLATQGADLGEFKLAQLLIYTLLASVLGQQLSIVTPATTAFWEGTLVSRYLRPAPVLLQLIAETIGNWLPGLVLYTLPMLLMTPFMQLGLLTYFTENGLLFMLSLTLSVSLGFAFDFLFAALVIRLKNAQYTAYSIRMAVTTILSGALIPFGLLPWRMGAVMELLPFGSLASAPLLVFVGIGHGPRLVGLQVFWNVIFWPLALIIFKRSQERMVSYGG